MNPVSRRDLLRQTLKVSSAGALWSSFGKPAADSTKLSKLGWVWEGQGVDALQAPSIYGVGEGARYFGLNKVIYMYHPNNEAAMEKLRQFEEVICDVTKWVFTACGYNCAQLRYDDARTWTGQRRTIEEVKTISTLSLTYHNIHGAFFDHKLGNQKPKWESTSPEDYASIYSQLKWEAISPEDYASISTELKKSNPPLKLWAIVYSEQLYREVWAGFKPRMDVITLWVRDSKDLTNLDRHVDRCREIFPDKPLVLGCYLWDFPTKSPMPLGLLKLQWERVLRHVGGRKIDGYAILGTYLIDSAPEQARWVRDFIAAN